MAYVIYSPLPKYIKIVKTILNKAKYFVFDTELPECIIVARNPTNIIPEEIRRHIQIEETTDYTNLLRGFDSLSNIIIPAKDFHIGDTVEIIKGTYEGFTGIVKKVNKKNIEVEISVWGRIIRDIFEFDHVKKIAKLF